MILQHGPRRGRFVLKLPVAFTDALVKTGNQENLVIQDGQWICAGQLADVSRDGATRWQLFKEGAILIISRNGAMSGRSFGIG